MAVRAATDLALAKRSLKVGEPMEAGAKLENSGTEAVEVVLHVENLNVEHDVTFAPTSLTLAPKSRTRATFSWTATLPDGKDALTYRGKLVLRRLDDMKVVASAPLDVYVAR